MIASEIYRFRIQFEGNTMQFVGNLEVSEHTWLSKQVSPLVC